MSDSETNGNGLPVSRRTVLKGVGGLGAGAVVGTLDPSNASATHLSVEDAALPTDMAREYYYDPSTDYCPMLAVRGLEQTNLAIVDGEDIWRDDCGDVPGIRHRFTATGVFQNVDMAGFRVSTGDTGCGRASFSPFYTWSGYKDEWITNRDQNPPTSAAEVSSRAREQHGNVFQPDEPADLDAWVTAANLAIGVAGLATGGIGWAVAGAALTVAEMAGLFDQGQVDVHNLGDHEVEKILRQDDPTSRFIWSDFSVVVPAGESVTFDVEWPISAGWAPPWPDAHRRTPLIDVPNPTSVVQRVHIPAIDVGQDVGAADTPRIEQIDGPIARAEGADRSVTLSARPRYDVLDTPDWRVDTEGTGQLTGSGQSISHQFADDDLYTASYRASDQNEETPYGETPYEYAASVSVPVGDEPFTPDGHPSVDLDVPATVDPGTNVTFTADASSPNGAIAEYEWTVYTSVQGEGRVEYESETGTGSPPDLTRSYSCGGYTVELAVRDDADQWREVTQPMLVAGPDPQPTIVAPDGAAVGEEVTLSYETADGVTVSNQAWTGAVTEGAVSPTVTFDSTGEKTIDLFVTTSCANSGRTSHTLTVADCSPPTVSVSGPETTDPGTSVTFDATVDGGSAPCGVDRHEWVLRKSVQGQGLVEVESQSGTGEPGTYSISPDCGGYQVELEVWNGIDQSTTATHSISSTGPDPQPTIQAPSTVEAGETVELSYTTADGVTVSNQSWTGAVSAGAPTTTVTFDSTGEKTIDLFVTTACANSGEASHTITVEDCGAPSVAITGPSEIDPGDTATFTPAVTGCSVESHEWRLLKSVQGQGLVEAESQTGTGDPGTYTVSPNCGGYTVELEVTGTLGRSGVADATFSVTGPDPAPTIQAPSTVQVGDEVSLSYTTASDVTVSNQSWSGAITAGGTSPTVSFSDPGEKTIDLFVTTACANSGEDSHTITVEDCSSPIVAITGPSEIDPGDSATFTPAVSGCSVTSHEWRHLKSVQGQGLVEVESQSGTGDPGTYSISPDCGGHTVELSVTGTNGGSAMDDATLTVSGPDPDPTIFAPSTVRVGESFELSYTTGNSVTVANQSWTGDVSAGGSSPTVSFDSTGTKTVNLFVSTACANSGSDSESITVEGCSPPSGVSVSGPGEVDATTSVSVDGSVTADCPDELSYTWTLYHRPWCGDRSQIDSVSGTGRPGSYSFYAETGYYDVELTVSGGGGSDSDSLSITAGSTTSGCYL